MSDVNQESMQPGQLELDALRFVTGEMGIDEQKRFEDRLASEPGVATLLSRVLELDAVVASGEAEPLTASVRVTPAPTTQSRSSAGAALPIVVAVAACLVLAVAIAPKTTPTQSKNANAVAQTGPEDSAVVDLRGSAQPELIENWLQAADIARLDPLVDEPGDDDTIELAMLEPAGVLDADSVEVVPDWLLDAVNNGETLEVGIE